MLISLCEFQYQLIHTILKIACAFVAALLHYLFLSAFCWMLCEGIMLYLLLVVVFGSSSHKIWIFMIIGYSKFKAYVP